jgi:hypothetical protein
MTLSICKQLIERFDHFQIYVLNVYYPCVSNVLLISQFISCVVHRNKDDNNIDAVVFIPK